MTLDRRMVGPVFGALALAAVCTHASRAEETTVAALARTTHFHGIAVDRADPSRLFLATHHGFYVVASDGKATRVSQGRDDYMGFTPHPSDPRLLYASGHPAGGGNLGFMASNDGGRTWTKLSDGVGGPVDFHQMDVSKAEPSVIYGAYGELQRSLDGGRTWVLVGPVPEGLIALASSARNRDTVYAATQRGLLMSRDAGRGWMPAHPARQPATSVYTAADGTILAFILGAGLMRAAEDRLDWQVVTGPVGRLAMLHLAGSPADPNLLYAVTMHTDTRVQSVQVSRDGGRSWNVLGGKDPQ